MRPLEKLDKWLLGAVTVTIVIVIVINFITSYGHIYAEGIRYGEFGTDARLMPIAIDGVLLALSLANVFAARFDRSSKLWRALLGFAVASTIAANAAYGARWGLTGGLLATWSPLGLFIVVEAGLFMFRVAAEASQTPRKPKIGRPLGSKNKPPEEPKEPKAQAPKPPETVKALKAQTESSAREAAPPLRLKAFVPDRD